MLHTWGSALTHHPHVHCVVPGGGLSSDGERWVSCRPGFFLAVRVLSRLFRRRFLEKLVVAHEAGQLRFFGAQRHLADRQAFATHLAPWRKLEWVVYAKRPFAGPEAVLAYLSRYTHRIAIANSRLVDCDDNTVTFKWKDYRAKGRERYKTMTLAAHEFIRRFLIHVLPHGFHRIRHGACPGLDPGACSPMVIAPRTSSAPAGCSPCRRPIRQTTRTPNRKPSLILAPVAADP